MEDYIPVTIAKTWKSRFLAYPLQHLQKVIDFHQSTIMAKTSGGVTPTLKRFQDDAFWQNLKVLIPNEKTFNELHEMWLQAKPLAQLDSKQLLSLLQEHVLPLERTYSFALKAFEEEKITVQANPLWPPGWFSPSFDQQISNIKKNQARLKRLNDAIQQALVWRCKAHVMLEAPRNVDDIVSAIAVKLNALSVLKSPLVVSNPYNATLNDDRRVCIYDYLEQSSVDKDKLYEEVLSVIPKQGHAAFKSTAQVREDIVLAEKFCRKTFNDLSGAIGVGSYLSSQITKVIPNFVGKVAKNTFDSIKDLISDLKLQSFFLKLWYLRYLAYLALSFISYHYMVWMLQPVVTILLGAGAFSLVSSFLFYTMALAPVWYLGATIVLSVKQGVIDYLTHWKKEEVYQSLEVLAATQEFMANHLSQVLIDIPRFDIQGLMEQANQHSLRLNESLVNLNRYVRGEILACRGLVNQHVDLVRAKLQEQQKQLQTHLKQVANHIALRVGDDIELLDKSLSKEILAPIISHQQLGNLNAFVKTFGDKKDFQLFEQNANPLFKWMNKVQRCSQAQTLAETTFAQPWGGHVIRNDYIRGWETILKGYIAPGSKQEAALQLNKLVAGKLQPTQGQVQEWINQLELGDNAPYLLQKIQDQLFYTLNPVSPQNARLLSENHRALIHSWYQQHQEEIAQAQDEITQLFSLKQDGLLVAKLNSLGDKKLADIYQLLDGTDIYFYACTKGESTVQHNLARQFFEHYEGETSCAIRYLRFIPETEKKGCLCEVAKKRLIWILNHLGEGSNPSNIFDATDTELFQANRLVEASELFNFSAFILQSKQFNAVWDPNVEAFLESCRSQGFDSGKLLQIYKEKNNRIKPFILSQSQNKELTSPSTIEVNITVEPLTQLRKNHARH